jgi:plasmid maintenance system antidote protein VapI
VKARGWKPRGVHGVAATATEILPEEFLAPIRLSRNALARCFGLSEGVFLGLQPDYDLMERRRRIGDDLEKLTPRGLSFVRVCPA